MIHDFDKVVSRKGIGASKWNGMYAEAEKLGLDLPEGVVPFSAADMEFATAPELSEGLSEFVSTAIFGYSQPTDEYYDAVMNWQLRRHNWKTEKDWIVISPGVVPAVANSVKAFTEPGDGVIILTPVYYPFYTSVSDNGRNVVKCPLIEANGTYTIDFELLEKLCMDPANTALVMCSPHNPVSRVWTREELTRLADITLRGNVFVISDEIHNDLIMPGYEHICFATISPEAEQNSVICTAPSKTFNLAGMQTSNIFIPNEERRAQYRKVVGHVGANTCGLKACELVYNRCEGWLDDLCVYVQKNAKIVEDFMRERIPEIFVYELEGTYLQWWDCRKLGLSPEELEKLMKTKAFMFLDEGTWFGEEGAGFERINLACPASILTAALERLAAALGR